MTWLALLLAAGMLAVGGTILAKSTFSGSMLRYLTKAFVARVNGIPLNVLAVAATVALAIVFRGEARLILTGGVLLELVYLFGLASNERFQAITDAVDRQEQAESAQPTNDGEEQRLRSRLAYQLNANAASRLQKLEDRCDDTIRIMRDAGGDDYLLESNKAGLKRLSWMFLKLLVARYNLVNGATAKPEELQRNITALEEELKSPALSAGLRESKAAMLEIARQRLANASQRTQTLEEIESDLARIEAQILLAQENATLRNGKPPMISGDLDLLSGPVDNDLFGADRAAVTALDQAYAQAQEKAAEASPGASSTTTGPEGVKS